MSREIGMYTYRSVTNISLVIKTLNNTWKHFFERPAVFRAHSRFILGRCQSGNQGEGVKGASAPFNQAI